MNEYIRKAESEAGFLLTHLHDAQLESSPLLSLLLLPLLDDARILQQKIIALREALEANTQ